MAAQFIRDIHTSSLAAIYCKFLQDGTGKSDSCQICQVGLLDLTAAQNTSVPLQLSLRRYRTDPRRADSSEGMKSG
jgi:hypothetical protein